MSQQAAAAEDPEPAGGEGRPGEEGRKKEEEEKEASKVVENGGLPGPTVVVQSRTIRFPSNAFLQLQIEKRILFHYNVAIISHLTVLFRSK